VGFEGLWGDGGGRFVVGWCVGCLGFCLGRACVCCGLVGGLLGWCCFCVSGVVCGGVCGEDGEGGVVRWLSVAVSCCGVLVCVGRGEGGGLLGLWVWGCCVGCVRVREWVGFLFGWGVILGW